MPGSSSPSSWAARRLADEPLHRLSALDERWAQVEELWCASSAFLSAFLLEVLGLPLLPVLGHTFLVFLLLLLVLGCTFVPLLVVLLRPVLGHLVLVVVCQLLVSPTWLPPVLVVLLPPMLGHLVLVVSRPYAVQCVFLLSFSLTVGLRHRSHFRLSLLPILHDGSFPLFLDCDALSWLHSWCLSTTRSCSTAGCSTAGCFIVGLIDWAKMDVGES